MSTSIYIDPYKQSHIIYSKKKRFKDIRRHVVCVNSHHHLVSYDFSRSKNPISAKVNKPFEVVKQTRIGLFSLTALIGGVLTFQCALDHRQHLPLNRYIYIYVYRDKSLIITTYSNVEWVRFASNPGRMRGCFVVSCLFACVCVDIYV